MARLSLMLISALCLSSAAYAGEVKPDAKKAERKICKEQAVLGSRVAPKRTCLTKAQWKQVERGGTEGVNDMQRRTLQNKVGSGY